MKTVKNALIMVSGCFVLLFSISPAAFAQQKINNLVGKECARCHSFKKVSTAKKDAAAWGKTVDRMIKKGANIKQEEKAAVVKYLNSMNR